MTRKSVLIGLSPRRADGGTIRLVTTGRTAGDLVEITNGLREGERIVTVGADKMPRQ